MPEHPKTALRRQRIQIRAQVRLAAARQNLILIARRDWLLARLAQHTLTQSDLARLLGYSHQQICYWCAPVAQPGWRPIADAPMMRLLALLPEQAPLAPDVLARLQWSTARLRAYLAHWQADRPVPTPDALKAWRVAQGLTQRQLAEQLGITPQLLSLWEKERLAIAPRWWPQLVEVLEDGGTNKVTTDALTTRGRDNAPSFPRRNAPQSDPTHPEETTMDTIAQIPNGHNALPQGFTQTRPSLPEAPCIVTGPFPVEGYAQDFQATGRGHAPAEAASNLAGVIAATRAALAPVTPLSRTERLGALLAKGLARAAAHDDQALLDRLSKAAYLVLSGAVRATDDPDVWEVKSMLDGQQRYVVLASTHTCTCPAFHRPHTGDAYVCKHGYAVELLRCLEAQDASA